MAPVTAIPWPSGSTPFPFQTEGVAALYEIARRHGGALLCDEMGLGKTPQAAVLASALLGGRDRLLVITPAGVRHQWAKWLADRKTVVLGPPSEKRYQAAWDAWISGVASTGVVSYSLMAQALGTRPKPRMVIFDEIHNFMQGRGNTYVKAWWKVSGYVDYKLGVTGSPLYARPAGLWQILNVLFGMSWGKAHDFDIEYCAGHMDPLGFWNNKGVTKGSESALKARLDRVMVRRMKADVAAQMPKVTRTVRWVDGTPAARNSMARMAITAHGMRAAQEPTLHGKIKEVVSLAKETAAPCIIFCWRRTDAENITAALDAAGERVVTVHGAEDPEARAALVRQATATKSHVVTTYGASGTGLDGLQHLSAHAIYHAVDPVPAVLLQAGARLDRLGQTLPVLNTVVAMKDSVDELVVEKVWERLGTHQAVLGKDAGAESMAAALKDPALTDLTNDKILQSIFDDIT